MQTPFPCRSQFKEIDWRMSQLDTSMYNRKLKILIKKFQIWCLSSILSETLGDGDQSIRRVLTSPQWFVL